MLKGEDLFDQTVRCGLQTGEMPTIDVDPDFGNTYSITGVVQAGDRGSAAVEYAIGEENGDSESFLTSTIDLVAKGFSTMAMSTYWTIMRSILVVYAIFLRIFLMQLVLMVIPCMFWLFGSQLVVQSSVRSRSIGTYWFGG